MSWHSAETLPPSEGWYRTQAPQALFVKAKVQPTVERLYWRNRWLYAANSAPALIQDRCWEPIIIRKKLSRG